MNESVGWLWALKVIFAIRFSGKCLQFDSYINLTWFEETWFWTCSDNGQVKSGFYEDKIIWGIMEVLILIIFLRSYSAFSIPAFKLTDKRTVRKLLNIFWISQSIIDISQQTFKVSLVIFTFGFVTTFLSLNFYLCFQTVHTK